VKVVPSAALLTFGSPSVVDADLGLVALACSTLADLGRGHAALLHRIGGGVGGEDGAGRQHGRAQELLHGDASVEMDARRH